MNFAIINYYHCNNYWQLLDLLVLYREYEMHGSISSLESISVNIKHWLKHSRANHSILVLFSINEKWFINKVAILTRISKFHSDRSMKQLEIDTFI